MSHTHESDGKLRPIACEYCEREFIPKSYSQRFCNPSCAAKGRRPNAPGPDATEKLCPNCGVVKPRSEYDVSKSTKSGMQCWCKQCFRSRKRVKTVTYQCGVCGGEYVRRLTAPSRELQARATCTKCYKEQKRLERGGVHPCYRGTTHFSGKTLSAWRSSADKRGHSWEVTKEELEAIYDKQRGLCALSGLPMQNDVRNPFRPSIDRVDSSKGYTADNVQFVCSIVNVMKNKFSEADFVMLCGLIWKCRGSELTATGGFSPQLVKILENTIDVLVD